MTVYLQTVHYVEPGDKGEEGLRGRSKTKSVTYVTSCRLCKTQGKQTIYIGESGRSLYERGGEHIKNSMGEGKAKSHIKDHYRESHPGEEIGPESFRYDVTGSYYSALDRQMAEAIKIQRAQISGVTVLNSKMEFNRCLIPAPEFQPR